jgi:hypothetical protein
MDAENPKTPTPSPLTTPTKRRHRRMPSPDLLSIRVDQIYFVLKSIEKNTRRPPPSFGARYRTCMSAGIMTCALTLSLTMLYVLYIGYYSPSGLFNRIFFLDRLYDLRELIARLRDGTIFSAMAEMIVHAFREAVVAEVPSFHVYAPPSPMLQGI